MSEKYKPKEINNTIKNIDTDNIHVRDIRNLINSDKISSEEFDNVLFVPNLNGTQ